MNYTELHLHTHYSLLDGLNTPEEYMKRAAELGMTHIAITDHGVLSGHRDFQKAAAKHNITPILGIEAYISATDRFDRRAVKKRDDNTQAYNHIGLLAQNEVGLRNLNRLSEIAWTEGFYSKPRIDMDVLEEYNEGIIVLSGCMNGLVSKAIEKEMPSQAAQYMQQFKDIFGQRFFVEIQGHNPVALNAGLLSLADRFDVLPVVTSDCHYARKEDLWLEDAMLILSTNPKPDYSADFNKSQKMEIMERFNYLYPDRQMTFQEIEIYLRNAVEQKELLAAQGIDTAPITNTQVVADMIEPYPYYENLDLLPPPKGADPHELLRKKTRAGMLDRGLKGIKEYEDRLTEELDIIKEKNFSSYFLIETNAVQWARSKGIMVGPGRGSAAGSLLCYVLGITNVDPIEHNLLFFRFINPERNDYPDIDTDFEDRRRGEVKDYMRRQYKHVASIATFGTFQGKNSVRDAARVFRVPLGDVNKALKGADWPSNMDWFKEFGNTEKGKDFGRKYPEVMRLAKELHERIRSQGMHAGGIILSKEPISNYAPMQTVKDPRDPAGNRIPLVAIDMDAAADIGFIKYDYLGLKALSILSDTVKMIGERHGKAIDLETMKFDDPNIYQMLSDGWTKGVFQCEQVPYTGLLIKMGGIKNFGELAASNALVRPGAANSTAGQDFIDRRKGKKPVKYVHETMKEFTEETYGTIIYQEQVMQAMVYLAGMKMSTADKVRKIIGKKRDVKEFEQYKEEFLTGCEYSNVSRSVAEGLWSDFEAHAGYSFNKSHAVAYSMLSYWTAWLKYYYPLEFMTAVLANEGDKDYVLDYLIEAKRLGLRIVLPHVNTSEINFSIGTDGNGDYIQFGLSNIKYISEKVGARLMEHRPYYSYSHLTDTVLTKGSGLNTRALQALDLIGAATFSDHPLRGDERENYYEFLNIPAFGQSKLSPRITSQLRTLDEYDEKETFVSLVMVRAIKTGDNWSRVTMVDETGTAAAFAPEQTLIETGQMYVVLISNNSIARYISLDDLLNGKGGAFRDFLETPTFPDVPPGMLKVISFNSRLTKAGKRMADVILSDEDKNLQGAMVWPSTFPKAFSKCKEGAVLDIQLRETDDGAVFVHNIL